MRRQSGHTARPTATQLPGHGCDHRFLTLQLNLSLIRKLLASLMCLASYFDMLPVGAYTIRHWKTSGRLVQELNVSTVFLTPCRNIFLILARIFEMVYVVEQIKS